MDTALDAHRKVLGSTEHEPEPGRNLVLTIDQNIQFMAERALERAMEKTQAASGTVVVQDVHSSQILALAIRPTFDPNQFRHTTPDLLRDHAVSDVYEPGSTFKLVTYAAAMDQRVATPDDTIDCQGGQIALAGRVIHDDKGDRGLGKVTVATALAKSSDVAAVKLALKVGPDSLYRYVRGFGFGLRSNIELPGETRGLLRPVNRWSPSSIGSIAIGQEVAVTPLQLVTMVSTIANGGVYLPPHILMPDRSVPAPNPAQRAAASQAPSPRSAVPQTSQIVEAAETRSTQLSSELPDPLPPGAHRVIGTLAAAEMRKMMEGVVLFGTGKPAQLNGYSSGGKTGTAQKIDPVTRTYSKTMHIASFAGFAPVNNPVISVAIIIDSPKGDYYGTAVSAPVFAEVAQQVLEYLGVPHDIDMRPANPSSKKGAPVTEDDSSSQGEDIQALYEAANDLPSDDPQSAVPAPPANAISAPQAQTDSSAANPKAAVSPARATAPPAAPPAQQPNPSAPGHTVVLSDASQIRVPSLLGLPVRQIIEESAANGLEAEIVGNGRAREQVPAPGAMVPPGTKIVVRCTR
jgi:cell division protein FtsI (penicillin-binding protein 3)